MVGGLRGKAAKPSKGTENLQQATRRRVARAKKDDSSSSSSSSGKMSGDPSAVAAAAATKNKKTLPTKDTTTGKRKAGRDEGKPPRPKKAPKASKKSKDSATASVVLQEEEKAKAATAVTKKAAYFTLAEDIAICKAFVNCTLDPIVGCNQKSATFWNAVHAKFNEILTQESDVYMENKWKVSSINSRFLKTISPRVSIFTGFHKQILEKEMSGWTPEMYFTAAMQLYLEQVGKNFKHKECVEILQKLPKFDPKLKDDDASDGSLNPVGNVQGSTMARPIGTKKAKLMKEKAAAATSVATSNNEGLAGVAMSNLTLARSLDRKAYNDNLLRRAEIYQNMGRQDLCMGIMQRIEAEEAAEAAAMVNPSPLTIPTEINRPQVHGDAGALNAALGGANFDGSLHFGADANFDTNDLDESTKSQMKDEEEEDSQHSSQPSDDSKVVKKKAAV